MSDDTLRHVNAISGRLSLRPPQRESLLLLDRVWEIIQPRKGQDVAAALDVIRSEFPQVEDFEREFPSLCFALATGVGKTRLMGAFAAYLHRAHGIRHFFVLAPNLTIYEKLIADFTPGHAKYVFQGIAEFAQNPPEIITGDNYESGRGVRDEARRQRDLYADDGAVHINIFNISKINSEVRGGKAPKIKRLSEYIGQSYFEYLSELEDLVLMMDESHRYRASAGVAAINELKPILGLELTATPRVETGGGADFKNVIYSYPLSAALNDGYVKEPAVATRENFNADNYNEDQLEKLKLEDGVRVHENVKVELEVYARQNGQPIVKPFMLVVAQDTTHADALVNIIQADDFFDGRYRDKVIQVHSNQRGEEKDETVERLLKVEDPDELTEIVVHVNKLKEGWDVTNLYTIVPLRAARSQILTEQTIGRGLRLPFGQRTGVAAVDRLTIIAHDQFQAIIDEANNPESIIKCGVVIGRDIDDKGRRAVTVKPMLESQLFGSPEPQGEEGTDGETTTDQQEAVFVSPREQDAARKTLQVIRMQYEKLPQSRLLLGTDVQSEIVNQVREQLLPMAGEQGELEGLEEPLDVESIVAKTTEALVKNTIDIPRVVVVPKGEVNYQFDDFDLDTSGISLQPVSEDILIQHLATHARHYLSEGSGVTQEIRLEDYLVRGLVDYDDISYEHHSELLFKLAGQVVAHLQGYLSDENEVLNVLQYHQRSLSELVHSQMQSHYQESVMEYEAKVSRGFISLNQASYSVPGDEKIRNYREAPAERSRIRDYLFGGFSRCLYPTQRFHSDPERQFAVLLENEKQDLKWFKPAERQFQIHFSHEAPPYEPDFVVETEEAKYLCEPKRADQMQADDVQAKARAAVKWCEYASVHEAENGGKPWKYLLIPHDAITATATLQGLAAKYLLN
ncbi:MAG: DEAD/DEAH box helicase family protein [Gammaproteobacteria bacterium]